MANSCNHLKALLKKNWILFKRSPCASCCEIIAPIVFVIILALIRSVVDKSSVKETSYITKSTEFPPNPRLNPAWANIPIPNTQSGIAQLDRMLSGALHMKY